MASISSSWVTPFSRALARWERSWSGRFIAMSAATVTRLRSRLESPGRSISSTGPIATKFGFAIDPQTGKMTGMDSRPEHIREVADASLKRLGVEVIPDYRGISIGFRLQRTEE